MGLPSFTGLESLRPSLNGPFGGFHWTFTGFLLGFGNLGSAGGFFFLVGGGRGRRVARRYGATMASRRHRPGVALSDLCYFVSEITKVHLRAAQIARPS